MDKLKKHADKFRFGFVGIINTAIDFGVLFLLVSLGMSSLIGNYISTTTALIFSFFANKKFTFKDNSKNRTTQIIRFLVVTLFGLWVIQPVIIEGVKFISEPTDMSSSLTLFVGKILATGASLVWNYVLYSRFVFNEKIAQD